MAGPVGGLDGIIPAMAALVEMQIESVRVAFLDPAGVVPNAREFFARLAPGRVGADHLIVEIHSTTGSSLTLTSENRAILNDRTRLETFVRTGRDPGAT